ncbi:hypothetical protein [Deinococcus sp. 6GRE01]|uniref:hypothetical protein n=1 Tax=Deinococcus sp. 6GRE01 TaxID=2745873 RepID=UPI001E2D13F4|nr:hypothetical protein [Deinococcus sp. 6GRE01]MCD0155812.1 hypothetical protein [Deinococcus sp. 6GRE01]
MPADPNPQPSADAANPNLVNTLPVVVHVMDVQQIPTEQQASLLALPVGTVTRARHGDLPDRLEPDQIVRMSWVTHIHVNLHRLYAEPTANTWMTRPNRRHPFDGKPPLAYALAHGIPGLAAINALLLSDLTDYPTTTHAERTAAETFTLTINADLTAWDQPTDNPHTDT